MKKLALSLVVLAAGFGSRTLVAQVTAPFGSELPVLYVGKFQPVEELSEGHGPLHTLNSDIRHMKSRENAARLSSALLEELRKQGARAEQLSVSGSARPRSGWAIQGVFYAMDQYSRLITVPFLNKRKGPNVEVSVSVSDFAKDSELPFALIGTDAVFKGQSTAISWNPYIAGAKFVLHQAQGTDSIQLLAVQIAQKIMDERKNLLVHDSPAATSAD